MSRNILLFLNNPATPSGRIRITDAEISRRFSVRDGPYLGNATTTTREVEVDVDGDDAPTGAVEGLRIGGGARAVMTVDGDGSNDGGVGAGAGWADSEGNRHSKGMLG